VRLTLRRMGSPTRAAVRIDDAGDDRTPATSAISGGPGGGAHGPLRIDPALEAPEASVDSPSFLESCVHSPG
jgi:hypothetical protein